MSVTAYRVRMSARAQRDLERISDRIHAADSQAAATWLGQLVDAMVSLERFPRRGTITAEDRQLRQLLYGRRPDVYRIIYAVHRPTKVVDVLHVRHGAQDSFKATNLDVE